MMSRILPTLAMLALASCAAPPPMQVANRQIAPLPVPTIADFSGWVNERYVAPFVAGDVPKWLEVFDDDAVALHNSLPGMTGKQAIAGFGNFVAANIRIEDMSVRLSEISINGNWAYTWGTYHNRLIMRSTGQPMPGHAENGKVLFLWERQTDGTWKIQVDMGNGMRDAPTR